MELFDQKHIAEIFTATHGRENNSHSEAIYVENMERLSKNSLCILKCLLEGQRISGMDCLTGIKSKDMEAPVRMMEYRKRIFEIIRAGFNVEFESAKNGCKTWFIKK